MDITPGEWLLWSLATIALGIVIGFPIGGAVAYTRFIPAWVSGQAEKIIREAAGE